MAGEPNNKTDGEISSIFQKISFTTPEDHHNDTATVVHKCAVCDATAKFCCAACDSTPLPSAEAEVRRWYCGKECQAKDWKTHKKHCKEVQARIDLQSLKRAVALLQALFHLFRHVAYDLSIASAERKGNVLHIKEGEYDLFRNLLPGYDAVESKFNLEFEDHAILLVMMACSDPVLYIHELFGLFLEDTNLVSNVEEIGVKPRGGPSDWVFQRTYGERDTPSTYTHAVHRITLKDGTRWAMDLSATQYGHKENLIPWSTFTSERAMRILDVNRFGSAADCLYKEFAPDDPGKMHVSLSDPASIKKAILWSQYQISQSMLKSIQSSLKALNISGQELLRTPSQAKFNTISQIITEVAWNSMLKCKQEVATRHAKACIATASGSISPPSPNNMLKARTDRHGNKHFAF